MSILFMQAEDVLLFRDGRPFSAGSDHEARSLFPPPPSVMQGVLRSHYLAHKNISLNDPQAIRELVGDSANPKGLRLRGPFLARRENDRVVRCFPTPADAYPADKKAERVVPMKVAKNPGGCVWGNEILPYLLERPNKIVTKSAPGEYLSEKALLEYLEQGKEVTPVKAADLYVTEWRLGIQIDSQRLSTAKGMLYEVAFIRLYEDAGLVVEILEGYPDFPPQGVMRAGGEGRALRYTILKEGEITPFSWGYTGELPRFFKVYFATPAYFSQGWKPASWQSFFTGEVRLEAVALSRYQTLGGYDLLNRRQKPGRRFVPAGSVYYFSHAGGVQLSQQTITEDGAALGFGQVIVAAWTPESA
ncbi:type III-B CRISPR module-associated protein Cmr3 [Thermanaerothrix sp. 4228-RoL]|uniref:Type III-B CRISPR module-associated protein Cmr3 n=1 Tax=Thermanaerothrix solaris TaxID=3058434 RepID=A0ABU3NLB4_9CHLR|nr:type III-B CRISPR module-associated protein Cmr3 [Thermanaerothrix sp. 4228-RoL]MDT8897622.1 type III-B CRISPR module-associated protein Cmr3 [Thermanaerothrix sp. 4228-RoL]